MTRIAITREQIAASRWLRIAVPRALQGREALTASDMQGAGYQLGNILRPYAALCRDGDAEVERRFRLWIADCTARALPAFEEAYPGDDRPRQAILAARAYARGEIDAAAMERVHEAAAACAKDAEWRTPQVPVATGAALLAEEATRDRGVWLNSDPLTGALKRALEDARDTWQLDRLVARMSDREPEDFPLN